MLASTTSQVAGRRLHHRRRAGRHMVVLPHTSKAIPYHPLKDFAADRGIDHQLSRDRRRPQCAFKTIGEMVGTPRRSRQAHGRDEWRRRLPASRFRAPRTMGLHVTHIPTRARRDRHDIMAPGAGGHRRHHRHDAAHQSGRLRILATTNKIVRRYGRIRRSRPKTFRATSRAAGSAMPRRRRRRATSVLS